MFTFLGHSFVLTKFGGLCSDEGLLGLNNETECQNAAASMKTTFGRYEVEQYYPKGCYKIGNAIFWNVIKNGERHIGAQAICHGQGKHMTNCFNYNVKFAMIYK